MAAALKLHSLSVLKSPSRISSIDFFRAMAILSVMLYHFRKILPMGYLGVDLFFVISGFLVGGIVVKATFENRHTSFFKFILQRGFKIWPSYYFFIFFIFWYKDRDFTWDNIGKYLFFYQNYTGESSPIWSLCVEEHFYILLPILFILIQKFTGDLKIKIMKAAVYSIIAAGILFKFASYYLTNSHDTFAGTHNRLDGLAWGVLLSINLYRKPSVKKPWLYIVSGLVILIATIISSLYSPYFKSLFLHSFTPVSFYLLMAGLYHVDFSRLHLLRIVSYYSYNIFLWHSLVGGVIIGQFGFSVFIIIVSMVASVIVGAVVTIIVEEPFLRLRESVSFLKK